MRPNADQVVYAAVVDDKLLTHGGPEPGLLLWPSISAMENWMLQRSGLFDIVSGTYAELVSRARREGWNRIENVQWNARYVGVS